MTSGTYSELDRLMSRYVDGVLDAGDLAKLEARLLADDEFVDRFARWCLTHRQIADLLTESALHHLMDQFVQTSPGLPRHTLLAFGCGRLAKSTGRRSWTGRCCGK